MGGTTKAEREWSGLRRVYRTEDFASVLHADRPDFVLRQSASTTEFGVEVTELYETEADARVELHPIYVADLLAGKPHLHKDDILMLRVEKVQIHDKDGNLKAADVPGIIRPTLSPQQHADAILELLQRKTEQAVGYRHDLSHINLIVIDRLASQRLGGGPYRTNELLVPELKEALVGSPFREVFLVSSDDAWRVYRPLQMLLLLESFEMFLGALESFEQPAPELAIADVVPLFVHLAKTIGSEVRLGKYSADALCAVYRGCGVALAPDSVRVLDFTDREPPPPVVAERPVWPAELAKAFAEHYARFADTNVFTVELAMPTVS